MCKWPSLTLNLFFYLLIKQDNLIFKSPMPHFPLCHAQFCPSMFVMLQFQELLIFWQLCEYNCLMLDDYLSYLMRPGSVLGQQITPKTSLLFQEINTLYHLRKF